MRGGIIDPINVACGAAVESAYKNWLSERGRELPDWWGMRPEDFAAPGSIRRVRRVTVMGATILFSRPVPDWYADHVRAHVRALHKPMRKGALTR